MNEVSEIILAFQFLVLVFALYYSFAFVSRLSHFIVMCFTNPKYAELKNGQSLVPSILWTVFWVLCQFQK